MAARRGRHFPRPAVDDLEALLLQPATVTPISALGPNHAATRHQGISSSRRAPSLAFPRKLGLTRRLSCEKCVLHGIDEAVEEP